MPFATRDGGIYHEYGCVMVNGKWKIHELMGDEWCRIETGLPADATECSPFAWYDDNKDEYHLTFIGGASLFSLPFRLYDRVNDGEFREITYASVGFQWKQTTVHGNSSNEFDVEQRMERRHFVLNGVKYIYRLTHDVNNPRMILASCKTENDEIHTYGIDIFNRDCHELLVDGNPTYKPCLIDGKCAYAVKCGEDFEDREIRVTDNWELKHLESFVEMTVEPYLEED